MKTDAAYDAGCDALYMGDENAAYIEELRAQERYHDELRHLMGEEVPVYLCGRPSSLREVAAKQVKESGRYTYMADIIRDDKGNITRVIYDRVRCRRRGYGL